MWIILAILLGLAVGLVIIRFGPSRSVLALVIGILLLLTAVIGYLYYHDRVAVERISNDRVSLSQVKIEEPVSGSYRLTARIKNESTDVNLERLGLTVAALDCQPGSATEVSTDNCETIGEQTIRRYFPIPAQQARDIREALHLSQLKPGGELRWQVRVTHTEGK